MTTPQKPLRIESIRIRQRPDDDPDTSWMGEYVSERPDESLLHNGSAFDRKADGTQQGRNEYRYFVACIPVATTRRELSAMGYSRDEAERLARSYCRATYKRMEALRNGDWHFVGISATADVIVDGQTQQICSGGLWGVESDRDEGYFAESVACEELADVARQLSLLGFSPHAIAHAIASALETLTDIETEY